MAAKDQTVTLGIGIDTGGTYTDCVLYDFKENKEDNNYGKDRK